jgi:hypothetical protein
VVKIPKPGFGRSDDGAIHMPHSLMDVSWSVLVFSGEVETVVVLNGKDDESLDDTFTIGIVDVDLA